MSANKQGTIKTYETGAVRDSGADDCMIALLPYAGLRRAGETMSEGAKKYKLHNWRAGFKWVQTMNHVLLHCTKWLERDTSEDHLGHALAGLMFLCEFEETHPELDDRYAAPAPKIGEHRPQRDRDVYEALDQLQVHQRLSSSAWYRDGFSCATGGEDVAPARPRIVHTRGRDSHYADEPCDICGRPHESETREVRRGVV